MADVGRCPALHPENMDATCSDEHGRLDLASSHVVDGGCARLLNVDKALFGQLRSGPTELGAALAGATSSSSLGNHGPVIRSKYPYPTYSGVGPAAGGLQGTHRLSYGQCPLGDDMCGRQVAPPDKLFPMKM